MLFLGVRGGKESCDGYMKVREKGDGQIQGIGGMGVEEHFSHVKFVCLQGLYNLLSTDTVIQSILLFTEVAHHSPVRLWYSKPLTVAWSNVDVDGTEVIVLLVTWRDKNLFTAQVHIPNSCTTIRINNKL